MHPRGGGASRIAGSATTLALTFALIAACARPLASVAPSSSQSQSAIASGSPLESSNPSVSPPGPSLLFASPPPAAGLWRSASIAPLGFVASVIGTTNGGYLAVGVSGWNGAIWASTDGIAWNPVSDVPPIGPQEAKALAGVVQTANGYLAWGGQGPRNAGPYLSVIWTSVGGTHWQERAVMNGFLFDLISGGPGYVGVGSKAGFDNLSGALARSSVDGITWTDSPPVPGAGDTGMLDLVAFEGGFLAVGASRGPSGSIDGKVWRSDGGVAWAEDSGDTALAAAGLSHVVPFNGRLVAGGSISVDPSRGWQRPAIYTSSDGSHWAQTYALDCCGEILGIVDAGDHLIAAYRWYVPEGPTGVALLRSADGEHWDEMGTPTLDTGVSWIRLLQLGGSLGLVGIGVHDLGNDTYQPVLLVPPPDLTTH